MHDMRGVHLQREEVQCKEGDLLGRGIPWPGNLPYVAPCLAPCLHPSPRPFVDVEACVISISTPRRQKKTCFENQCSAFVFVLVVSLIVLSARMLTLHRHCWTSCVRLRVRVRVPTKGFYIRCNLCASEIAFKTDPKNTDYVCEIGATRNFENWREAPAEDEAAIEARGEAEEQNPMAALEARTKESKQEMDILDALEEIKDLNARKMNVDIDDLIAAKEEAKAQLLAERRAKKEAREAAADDAAVAAAFGGGSSSGNVKRLESSSDEDEAADARSSARGPSSSEKGKGKAAAAAIRKRGVKLGPGADGGEGAAESGPAGKKRKLGGMLGGLKGLIKKKATGAGPTAAAPAKPKAPAAGPAAANNDGDEGGSSSSDDGGGGGGGGLLGSDYGSSSD